MCDINSSSSDSNGNCNGNDDDCNCKEILLLIKQLCNEQEEYRNTLLLLNDASPSHKIISDALEKSVQKMMKYQKKIEKCPCAVRE